VDNYSSDLFRPTKVALDCGVFSTGFKNKKEICVEDIFVDLVLILSVYLLGVFASAYRYCYGGMEVPRKICFQGIEEVSKRS
jgi:hypothetical protein